MLFKAVNEGPFRHRNVRLYTWFTIFFSARFYYPILAILFLDLGLSLAQFISLNAIWAATIFLAEVPSGALADLLGRRKLLIAAGALMMLEMLALLLAPQGAGSWLFLVCALNRILSGLAEAAASGADQALAYDTLEEHGEADSWDEVLETTMRWQSGAMIFAMILGAGLYDPSSVNRALELFGLEIQLTLEQTLRIPVFLCLLQAIAAFGVSLRFQELTIIQTHRANFQDVFAQTWQAARWVMTTKAACLIVLGGVLIDGITRNFATINSEYYRLITIPEWTYGFIAAAIGFLGLMIPKLSRWLAQRYSVLCNLSLTATWVFLCLLGLAQRWNIWGILPAIGVMAALGHLGFLLSRWLNRLSSSKQRATVLSVKGLIFNIGYGSVSLAFSGYVALHHQRDTAADSEAAFSSALYWQPWVFALLFASYLLLARRLGMKDSTKSLMQSTSTL